MNVAFLLLALRCILCIMWIESLLQILCAAPRLDRGHRVGAGCIRFSLFYLPEVY
ncbi:MAG: hypothetical protein JO235_15650 [Chroococcidiopsidaceae cyanobacterium CP_BM_RX_35]|nr:hypothetical protein [Chroococcidiopsidaceae cyanobacterium CP_BM_RX_35]